MTYQFRSRQSLFYCSPSFIADYNTNITHLFSRHPASIRRSKAMIHIAITLLLTLLPLLTFASHNPPHLRHGRLSNTLRYVRDGELETRALHPSRANDAHAEAHRTIKRQVAKRGNSCQPRQVITSDSSSTTSSAWSETSSTMNGMAALAANAPASSTSSPSQGAWSKHVGALC